MVQQRLISLKTGIHPNPRQLFNVPQLSPLQKMQLVRCRIWGNTIGDNYKTGLKRLKKGNNILRSTLYETAILKDQMPWVEDWNYIAEKKIQFNNRRTRILMRGVKIGQRRLTQSTTNLSIFNTKRQLPPVINI